MKAQQEAEKPFWWEHLHPEVKDKSIEEIEKELLQGNTLPEKIARMTRHEKYLAISEGYYVAQCKDTEIIRAELETLKKDSERSKTSFLNQSSIPNQQNTEDNFEPIVFGQKPVTPIQSVKSPDDSLFAAGSSASLMGGSPPQLNSGLNNSGGINNSDLSALGGIKDDSSFAGEMNSVGGPSSLQVPMNSAEIRKYAQSIVSKTVNDINAKADEIPDDVAVMKEHELLQAVINELQTLK